MGLCHLAWTVLHKGELAETCLLAEECMEISDALGAGLYWTHYSSQNILGMAVAHLGQYKEARVHLQQSLALAQQADTLWAIGHGFLGLGLVALAEGDFARARQLLQEGIATGQEGKRSDMGSYLAALAGAALGLGRRSEAREHLCKALALSRAMRETLTLQFALPMAALLLADSGDSERAVEVYAQARRFGIVAHSRLWEDIAGRQITALSAALPPDVVAAAQERGRTRDLWATVEDLLAACEGRGVL
jgi:tetratricopeptide (TPR) repeat protein